VTWQLASFLILAAGLVIGFGWYERSRPSARVLALVAALAALAVVGRLAFAAFPNVKPTTDIVLLAGYSLGGAAGFAVGAITPVVSNVFLGHGPWTPWQMAAWGGVGIAGAALRQLASGRELGRWSLALACALAGAGFGVVMDTYQWTLAAEQDAATWLAVSGSSLPYNLAHVIGNVVFCLLIGPAFLRALNRYRRRFEVRWAPAAAAAAGVLLLVAAPGAAAKSGTGRALSWLERAQNRDGGFGAAPDQGSSGLFSGWAALGLAAGGKNPADVRAGGRSAIDYIRRTPSRKVGDVERTILVLGAAGISPRDFAGRNLVARLKRFRRGDGSFSGYVSYTAFGVLALRSAGAGGAGRSARWLAAQQNADGGFGVAPKAQSDVDNTGAVLQALAAAGRGDGGTADRAVEFLRGLQNSDGGFGQSEGRSSNAQSTAYAVQGLVAAGRSPGRFRRGAKSPLGYLRARQQSDGSIRYSKLSAQTPVWVTAQVVMALRRKPLPLAPVPREERPAERADAGVVAPPAADDEQADAEHEDAPKKPAAAREESPDAAESDVAGRRRLGPPAPAAIEEAQPLTVTAATESRPGWWPALLLLVAAAAAAAARAGTRWRRRARSTPSR